MSESTEAYPAMRLPGAVPSGSDFGYPSSSSDEEAVGLDFLAPLPYVRRHSPMGYNRRLGARFRQMLDVDEEGLCTVAGAVPLPPSPPAIQVRHYSLISRYPPLRQIRLLCSGLFLPAWDPLLLLRRTPLLTHPPCAASGSHPPCTAFCPPAPRNIPRLAVPVPHKLCPVQL